MFRIYRENCNKSFGKKENYRHEDRARTRECEYGGGARVNDSVAALSNVHGCPEKHLRKEMMR